MPRRTVALLVAAAAAALVTAAAAAPRAPHTLGDVLAGPGPRVQMVQGTGDYAAGKDVRVSFLVVRSDGKLIDRPSATVWLAPAGDHPIAEKVRATAEDVGLPGKGDAGDIRHLYVAHLTIPRPGQWWVVAVPDGGAPIKALGTLAVARRPKSPAVGDAAYPSQNPTLATEPASKLTTASPPDTGLLDWSIAGSLKAHAPFVVTFATPKFCTSRTCGPVVDVVDAVRSKLAGRGVRFIHVEIYKDNDPTKGPNAFVAQWHLPSEPWTFLVGSDGRIRDRLEGSFSQRELTALVQRDLLR